MAGQLLWEIIIFSIFMILTGLEVSRSWAAACKALGKLPTMLKQPFIYE